jgi:hypothetical protein
MREVSLGFFQFFNNPLGMSVSRINDNGIRPCIHQSPHALQSVIRHSHSGSNAQTTFAILARHRFILCLGNILIGNQTYQFVVFIYYRQLLDSMFLQNLRNSLHIRRRIGSNDVLLSHYLIDTLIHIFLKTKVTIGNNAYQISFIIYHRNTTNLVFSHQSQRISYRRTSLDSHRVINHTVFGTLHNSYLTCLLLNGHILMNNSDTTFAGNGNSHLRFGNRIHGSSYKRDF